MWAPASFAPAKSGVSSARLVSRRGLMLLAPLSSPEALSGPASITARPSMREPSNVALCARAVRVCNRNHDLNARYLTVHQILARGA